MYASELKSPLFEGLLRPMHEVFHVEESSGGMQAKEALFRPLYKRAELY
jgi:hypothetical protein